MQEQMLKAQEELGGKTIEGSSGGGVVTVQVNGHKNCSPFRLNRRLLIRKISKCCRIW